MRRAFRRDARKGFASQVPPILQEANLAFDKGEFGRAAQLFERIAEGADARGGPRASLFHLQAGRARVLAGQVRLGLPSLKRALSLLAERGELVRLQRAASRCIDELNMRKLTNEAIEIEAWLKDLSPVAFSEYKTQPPLPKRPALPTHCPHCGASLRPDEVDWLDDVTAECGYCGSPVRE